jgi:hypothetical protein
VLSFIADEDDVVVTAADDNDDDDENVAAGTEEDDFDKDKVSEDVLLAAAEVTEKAVDIDVQGLDRERLLEAIVTSLEAPPPPPPPLPSPLPPTDKTELLVEVSRLAKLKNLSVTEKPVFLTIAG